MTTNNQKKDDGGPAFPAPGMIPNEGMTLRDWFAGQVAGQVLATLNGKNTGDTIQNSIAAVSYAIADAMLEARRK